MKEVKFYCDCCKKQIEGLNEYERPSSILIKDFSPMFKGLNDSKDLCKNCYYEIMKATYDKFQELKK